MAYDQKTEFHRPYNPWEKFTRRDEAKHTAEDILLCRPGTPITTAEVIHSFLTHGYNQLDQAVPRKRQLLRDFLEEVINSRRVHSTVDQDIFTTSRNNDVALLDDRLKHERCARSIGQACNHCTVFSKNLTIPDLYKRLQEKVCLSFHLHTARWCIILICLGSDQSTKRKNE